MKYNTVIVKYYICNDITIGRTLNVMIHNLSIIDIVATKYTGTYGYAYHTTFVNVDVIGNPSVVKHLHGKDR